MSSSKNLKVASLPFTQKNDTQSVKRACLFASFFCIFLSLLFLKNPAVASSAVSSGLSLTAKKLIPSLFPFMVISAIISTSPIVEYLGKILERPSRALFGMCGEAGCAFIISSLCGFPIGAIMGSALSRSNKLSKEELVSLLSFSSNPGAAFIIFSIGREALGSTKKGIILYLINLISALVIGVALKQIQKSKGEKEFSPLPLDLKNQNESSFSYVFTEAVKSSAMAMLTVSAFVVFFSTIVGTLDSILSSLGSGYGVDLVKFLSFGLLELTSAIFSLPGAKAYSFLLASAFIGWSGLSVHFQIISVCENAGIRELRLSKYFFSKLTQAAINVLATSIIIKTL